MRQQDRTRIRQHSERGSHERAALNAVLDEALVCHVGFCQEGRPLVIPMSFARDGARMILHGAAVSRLLRTLADEVEVSVCVTLLDGLVLARSAFAHSVNYRSAVIFGRARRISGAGAKKAALDGLVEHIVPGRSKEARPPDPQELLATEVLELPLEEFSVKTRSGPPLDKERDRELPVWAGVIPLETSVGAPLPDPGIGQPSAEPAYVSRYRRPGG